MEWHFKIFGIRNRIFHTSLGETLGKKASFLRIFQETEFEIYLALKCMEKLIQFKSHSNLFLFLFVPITGRRISMRFVRATTPRALLHRRRRIVTQQVIGRHCSERRQFESPTFSETKMWSLPPGNGSDRRSWFIPKRLGRLSSSGQSPLPIFLCARAASRHVHRVEWRHRLGHCLEFVELIQIQKHKILTTYLCGSERVEFVFEFEGLAEVFRLELGEVVLPPLQLGLQLAHLLLLLPLLLHDLSKFRLLLRDFIPQFVAQLKLLSTMFRDSFNYQISHKSQIWSNNAVFSITRCCCCCLL